MNFLQEGLSPRTSAFKILRATDGALPHNPKPFVFDGARVAAEAAPTVKAFVPTPVPISRSGIPALDPSHRTKGKTPTGCGSSWASGRVRGVLRGDVVEGVVGGKAFRSSGGQKRRVPADENQGKPESRQNAGVSQGDSQLNGIVGFKRVLLGQIRSIFQISGDQRYNRISGDKLAHKTPILSIPLGSPNPSDAFDHRQPCCNFHTGDLGNENGVNPFGLGISIFHKVTNPRASRFCHIVFDERASIKIVKGHITGGSP
jgi:hypothetical protein